MAAFRCSLCIVVGLLAASWLRAEEPPKPYLPNSAQPPKALEPVPSKSTKNSQPHQAIEAKLQEPADLDFGDRKTVPMQEIIEQLHTKHHLSIRFDTPI